MNEIQPGALQSFMINANGTLSAPQDTVATDGGSPAFAAALSTGQVGVMNYNTGNGRIISTMGSPLLFDKNAPVISFPQKPNTTSHPHMMVEHGNEVFVPDLVNLFFVEVVTRNIDFRHYQGARYDLALSSEHN